MSAVLAEKLNEQPKPFLKWVGGKRQLLPELLARVPRGFDTYFEPFLGGGALFFSLLPEKAVLSDTNERLVRTYRAVRDNVDELIAELATYPHDRVFFEELRRIDVDALDDTQVAAWMIYLNKTGFNGLYRVNKSGGFNVPFGRYKNPRICDPDRLLLASEALQRAEILHASFSEVTKLAKPGDFVYFDPPYVPLSETSSFTSYTKDGFGISEQRQLRNIAENLKAREVDVLLSNSSAGAVFDLYENFEIEEVYATRAINSKASARGKVAEVLIR
ncbi:MAG: DNA adenine methylase [Myxococcota bacterium]|nr:DNA adenine methylase [Myxococcota bacterium]